MKPLPKDHSHLSRRGEVYVSVTVQDLGECFQWIDLHQRRQPKTNEFNENMTPEVSSLCFKNFY